MNRQREADNSDIEAHLIDDKVKRVLIGSDRTKEADYYFRGNPISLYCTNIDTIMGGRNRMWRNGRGRSGLVDDQGHTVPINMYQETVEYNDGKLEFASFPTLFHIGLSKTNRVLQSEGPFEFKFKEEEDLVTFINIDGEFYRLENIRNVRIRRYLNGSAFNVLINPS